MKRALSGAIATSIILVSAPMAFADSTSDITIKIDGQVQQFDPGPVIVHDRTLVPLRSVFEKMGATVSWDAPSQTVTITKNNTKIQISIDSPFAVINGFRKKLDEPAHIVDDRTMVPLRFVSEALGADVQWDATNRTVLISTNGLVYDSKSANNAASMPLTYQKALELATANSYPIKEGQASVDRAKEVLDHTADNINYIPASGGDTAATRAFTSYATANINYQSAQKALEYTQDSLAYAVKRAYNAVLQAQEAKNLADLQVQNAAIQQQMNQAKYQNGLLSDIDLQQSNSNYNSLKASQEAAQKTLENAYQQLDQLIGFSPDARPQLLDIPQMQPIGQVDLDTKVSQAESESPLLWQINHKVDLAQLGLKLYTFNDPTADPYHAKEIDVNLATYNAADQQNQLDKSVRSLYFTIKQLEDQYNSLQASLAAAEDNLKKTQTMYDNGMAVQADLISAKLNVETIKQKMFDLVAQHDNDVMAFEKPWVQSSGGGQ
jgi:outer membrane protein TolC